MRTEGSFDGRGLRIGIVRARFNAVVTERLAAACRKALERHGVAPHDIDEVEVPGARELPVACRALAVTGRYQAVVAVGCVIRGETRHFELVADEASRGLGQVAVDTGVPVLFAVLATDTLEQALQRAGGKMGNAGWDAGVSAIEMASLIESIGKTAAEAGEC